VDFPQGAVFLRDPVEYAVEIDRIELTVAKPGQILRAAQLERQRFRLPQPRDVDAAFQRVDSDDAALRADQAGNEFGQASRPGADVENMLACVQRQGTDQELAVMELNDAGARNCGQVRAYPVEG
jgi:hypothetical protein